MRSDPMEAPYSVRSSPRIAGVDCEAPPADLGRISPMSVEVKTYRLKFILRISQNMQHPKSIRIGHISNPGYPQVACRCRSYPREICLIAKFSWLLDGLG